MVFGKIFAGRLQKATPSIDGLARSLPAKGGRVLVARVEVWGRKALVCEGLAWVVLAG
jgi:hypothetical protein